MIVSIIFFGTELRIIIFRLLIVVIIIKVIGGDNTFR